MILEIIWMGFSALFLADVFLKLTLHEKSSVIEITILWITTFLSVVIFSFTNFAWVQYFFCFGIMLIFLHKSRSSTVLVHSFLSLLALFCCSFVNYGEQLILGRLMDHFSISTHLEIAIYLTVIICNMVVLTFIPRRFFEKIVNIVSENDYFGLGLVVLSVSFFFFLLVLENVPLIQWLSNWINPTAIIMLGMMFAVMFISLGFYSRQLRLKNEALVQLVTQTDEMEGLIDDTALFRHDFLNILYSLKMAIAAEDMIKIKEIYDNTIAPTEKFMSDYGYTLTKLNKIKLPELRSLLYVKLSLAHNRKLNVSIIVDEKLSSLPIDTITLLRCISILLDNAIEEAEKSEEKEIGFTVKRLESFWCFKISNSTEQEYLDLRKIFMKGYSTRETKNGAERGLGLYSLRNMIENNDLLDIMTDQPRKKLIQNFYVKSLSIVKQGE